MQQYRVYVSAAADEKASVTISPDVAAMLREARELGYYVVGERTTLKHEKTLGYIVTAWGKKAEELKAFVERNGIDADD